MSRKTTAALIAALGINFALAGGALVLANLNKPPAYEPDADFGAAFGDIESVAGIKVDAHADALAVPLKAAQQGGNTRVTFTCGKAVGGGREVHEGTWEQIAGAVLYQPDQQKLVAVEAVFDTRSLKTDAQGLTTTVTTNEKWFDIDNHPTATFTCDSVKPTDAATPSHTHDLVGSFTLNGITKPLTIPAKLAFAGQSLTIDAEFMILRSDFDVKKRANSVAGTLGGVVSEVEDEVVLTVRVTASPDAGVVISELAQIVEDQQERLRIADIERKRLQGLVGRIEVLEETAGRLAVRQPASPPADTGSAPYVGRYTDRVPVVGGTVPFEMVLVPGSEEAGVGSIYMSTHEVTWAMLRNWMEAAWMGTTERAKLEAAGLHPSIVFGPPSELIQMSSPEHPAMAMSRRTATAYCKWLSEKTGRRYRLPTMEEWMHAFEAGGGVPAGLDAYAWHAGNAPKNEASLEPMTSPAGSKKPNTLGIHDMLGGVAEWVTNTGESRVVVGGTIFTAPEELNADWRAVEDVEVWSANYPQFPKSQYWYSDFYVTGIRLVCEPASVAANPPESE